MSTLRTRFALLALLVLAAVAHAAIVQELPVDGGSYLLEASGNVLWQGAGAAGRELVDNGIGTRMIAGARDHLFILKDNGNLWRWEGGRFTKIDAGTSTRRIWVDEGTCFAERSDGAVYRAALQPDGKAQWERDRPPVVRGPEPRDDSRWDIIARSHEAETRAPAGAIRANARSAYAIQQRALARGRLTRRDVLQLNAAMRAGGLEGDYVKDAGGGRIRTQPVAWYEGTTRVLDFPPPDRLGASVAHLDALLDRASQGSLPRAQAIDLSTRARAVIVHDQLFSDANHRTARAVSDWIQMRHGLPPGDWTATAYHDDAADLKLPLEAYVARTRPAVERAVEDGERHVPGAATEAGFAQFGLVAGVGKGLAYTAGMAGAGEALREVLAGERLSARQVAHAALGPATISGALGFFAGDLAASAAVAALAPVPGLGLLARPLVASAVAGIAGAAGAGLAGHLAVPAGKLDAVDLIGSSIASGIGLAVGAALLPGVGGVLGGIAGGLAWDLARSLLRRPATPAAARAPRRAEPSAPVLRAASPAGVRAEGPSFDDLPQAP